MQLTIRDLLNSLFRYSRAVGVFCAVLVGAVLVFYSQTNKLYDSTATIMVSLGSESAGRAEYLNGKNLQIIQREQEIHDEQQILQSHEVLLTAARWLVGDPTPGAPAPEHDWRLQEAQRFITGQAPEPTLLLRVMAKAGEGMNHLFGKPRSHDDELNDIARTLSKSLSVNVVFDSDALDVRFRYRDPRVAQTVLRLVVAAYIDHHVAVYESAGESDLLKTQLNRSVDQYHERLDEFSSYMTQHQVYNDDSQVSALIEQREKLDQALNEAVADNESAVAQLASLKAVGSSLQQFERYSTTEVRNKLHEDLASKVNDAIVEEQAVLTRHPQGSRAYQDEQSKLDVLRSLLTQEPAQIVEQTEQRRSKSSELVDSQIIDVTETQQGDLARIERLREDRRNLDARIGRYATDLKGFNALKLNLGLAKQESEQLAQAFVDSRLKSLTAKSAITDISIVDAPNWDSRPASPKKSIVLAATAGMLVMGSLAIFLGCMGLDTTVADSKTAELKLGVPVIGSFPLAQGGENVSETPALFTRENRAQFARIYHTIRGGAPGGKVILVAESNAKEGASLVGYGLARFLSHNAYEKTAFIDCTANSIDGILPDGSPNQLALRTLPDPEHAVVKREDETALMIGKLRQEFAYIVIACGAVREATELLALSGIVAATFLIVEAEKTRRATALHSIDLLRQYGFQNTSVILNKRIFYLPNWLMRFV